MKKQKKDMKNENNYTAMVLLSITYIFFLISNITTIFFNFELGLKFNSCISSFSDVFFLTYIWTNKRT